MAQLSLQKLEADLAALTENFASLVRSARIADESDEARRPNVRTLALDLACYISVTASAYDCEDLIYSPPLSMN